VAAVDQAKLSLVDQVTANRWGWQ